MPGIILEGLTGTGKTHTLEALQKHPTFPTLLKKGRIVFEEETLGELVVELKDPTIPTTERCARLHHVLHEIQQETAVLPHESVFVLERFHHSYYALMPDWSLYSAIDQTLHALHYKTVLLDYSADQLEHRALHRIDQQDTTWVSDMIDYFGTKEAALHALDLSQQRRRHSLSLSALPSIRIDTTAMNWPAYADRIVSFWQED